MRQELKNKNYILVYGKDHIEGLFFELWTYDGEGLIESASEMTNPLLTIQVIAAIVKPYGFDLSHELPEEVVEY